MAAYNPLIHHRKSIRLPDYDYSSPGLYFITICVQNRKHFFGNIENNQMVLNEYGQVAHNQWEKLPQRFTNTLLDVFQIMPNHMHGIIKINDKQTHVGAGFTPARDGHTRHDDDDLDRAGVNPAPTVANIVGAYKSIVSKQCLEIFKTINPELSMGKLFQRIYYEHIIRNEQSYLQIANYIQANPANWKNDMFYNS